MNRVYISGPMTGLPECNFPAFHAAAASLRSRGYEVSNPAEINKETNGDWCKYLRADIKALCDCDVLVLLPGWESSKGAHLELHVAHRLGLRVVALVELLQQSVATEDLATHAEKMAYERGQRDMQNAIIDKLGSYEANKCAQIAASVPVGSHNAVVIGRPGANAEQTTPAGGRSNQPHS